MYKTKLQELCHERKWGLPNYSSNKYGPDHNPRFKASVSVNGISFDNPSLASSSKEAHNLAARQAFHHFTSTPSSPLSGSSPTRSHNSSPSSTVTHMGRSQDSSPRSSQSPQSTTQASSICSPTTLTNLHNVTASTLVSSKDAKKGKATTTGTTSYLLSNRVRVYTSYPDITFPKNVVVLPVGDNKWVPVWLEFPNEACN